MIAPRSVRCRSGASRAPDARSRLWPSCSRICGGLHQPDARGRELDRQRQAAEPLADRPDRGARCRRPGQVGPVQVGEALEQGDAGVDVERRHRIAALPADPQQLAAGDDGRSATARRGRVGRRVRGGRQQLLEVVEDEQQDPIAKVGAQRPRRSPPRTIRRARSCSRWPTRRARRRGSRRGRRTRCHAGTGAVSARRDTQREAGLAAAAGAGQRDDPALGERLADGRRSRPRGRRAAVTSPGRFEGGSIVRSGRASSAAPITSSRWSCAGSSKSLTARSPSSTSRRRPVGPAARAPGRPTARRDDDLAAVAGGGDAGGVVHVDADVVLGVAWRAAVAKPPLALVEAHPDAERRLGRPRLGGERPLGGDGGVGGILRSLEGREERVTLGLDDDAAGPSIAVAQQAVVARDDARPRGRSRPTARGASSPRCR